jgi:predicted transcriptional regulator
MKTISIEKRSYLRSINQAIPMDKYFYAPTTKEEACRHIEEAERDIAEGKVVPHEEVMRRTYELLKKYGC